jgi:hypothetical protein
MRAAAGILVLVVLIGGCLFDPREPEGEPGAACFEVVPAPTDPLEVIFNMDGSVECFQGFDYLRQLSDEFVFIPAPSVQINHPDLFPTADAWGKDQEEAYINALLADSSQDLDSRLLLRVIERSGTTEVLIEAEYLLTISAGTSQFVYTGEAFYAFRQENTVWVMVRWEEKESDNPLGALKAELVGGR